MKQLDENIPTLTGTVTDTNYGQQLIQVWCPYCKVLHRHGWDGEESHRIAHCAGSNPLRNTGYYVKPFPKIKT